MKLQSITKAFTLIELLVVITIIGILATGATTVYTSQIQKARDTTRINDVRALQSAIEQSYQDASEYPHADDFAGTVSPYLASIPKDGKHAQPCNNSGGAGTDCAYAYIAWADDNGIEYGFYEVSTAFENSGNVSARANNDTDNGNDAGRLELWVGVASLNTTVAANAVTAQDGACGVNGSTASNGTQLIVINGNPADPSTASCG